MHIAEAVRVALQSLWANKLRSVLTLLGVVIGVGAVIAVLTFVSGINRYIAEKVFNLGADVFIINKHSSVINANIDQLLEAEKRKDITLEDYYAVAEGCDRCSDLGAVVTNLAGKVKYGQQSINNTFIRGLTPSMPAILNTDLSAEAFDQRLRRQRSRAGGCDWYGSDGQSISWRRPAEQRDPRRRPGLPNVIGVGKKQGTTLGIECRDNFM